MKDDKLLNILEQSVKRIKLDLSGLSLLLPESPNDPTILPLVAGLAGAENVYIMSKGVEVVNKIMRIAEGEGLETRYFFLEKETPEILSRMDILVKGKGMPSLTSSFISKLKSSCVISIFPDDFDFYKAPDIDMDCCLGRKIPVVAFDPSDKTLTIYKYFSNLILKRCYEAGLDVFRSRIMLISNGELLDNTIGMLKPTGVQVYAANTTEKNNKDYILKHLPELDAIIVADYPEKSESIIGRDSLIEIDDLIEINSDVTVIHLAGKVDARSLEFNSIKYIPKIIKPNSLNVNFSEFGIRAISDLSVGVLGAAGSFIKTKNLTMPSKGHIVSYIILNKENHGLLNF